MPKLDLPLLFFSWSHGQSEHEEEGCCQGHEAGPCRDSQCVGGEMVVEDGEEDGAEDCDSERARGGVTMQLMASAESKPVCHQAILIAGIHDLDSHRRGLIAATYGGRARPDRTGVDPVQEAHIEFVHALGTIEQIHGRLLNELAKSHSTDSAVWMVAHHVGVELETASADPPRSGEPPVRRLETTVAPRVRAFRIGDRLVYEGGDADTEWRFLALLSELNLTHVQRPSEPQRSGRETDDALPWWREKSKLQIYRWIDRPRRRGPSYDIQTSKQHAGQRTITAFDARLRADTGFGPPPLTIQNPRTQAGSRGSRTDDLGGAIRTQRNLPSPLTPRASHSSGNARNPEDHRSATGSEMQPSASALSSLVYRRCRSSLTISGSHRFPRPMKSRSGTGQPV